MDQQAQELTAEQLAALQDYAEQRGRTWRAQLLDDWMNGRCCGELQQVRNAFGPSWLRRYKLRKTLIQASYPRRRVPASAGPQFRHSENPQPASLTDMLAANVDDPGLCDWLRAAEIGEVFPGIVSVERVS